MTVAFICILVFDFQGKNKNTNESLAAHDYNKVIRCISVLQKRQIVFCVTFVVLCKYCNEIEWK